MNRVSFEMLLQALQFIALQEKRGLVSMVAEDLEDSRCCKNCSQNPN